MSKRIGFVHNRIEEKIGTIPICKLLHQYHLFTYLISAFKCG